MTGWHTYIVRCADDTLYTGVCTDIERRIEEHNNSTTHASRYTRARRPVTLVYFESTPDRSSACKREFVIKQMSKLQKLKLIRSQQD